MKPVVNIRGTSGSGKSTVVHRLIAQNHNDFTSETRMMCDGKVRHAGHWMSDVFLVGKYATQCGGCDSMSWKGAADDICNLIIEKCNELRTHAVVAEGLMLSSWGSGRLLDLSRAGGVDLTVIMLTTPLDECLRSVQERRVKAAAAKGKEALPLNPENTTKKWHASLSGAKTIERMGVRVLYLDREAAFQKAMELVA